LSAERTAHTARCVYYTEVAVALCFEVTINDEPPVIAGLDDIAVLAATVTYAAAHNELECRIGGLVSKGRHDNEHLEWLLRDLKMGDQVVIRLVDAPTPSAPVRRPSQ
jgi:hypothetical protein